MRQISRRTDSPRPSSSGKLCRRIESKRPPDKCRLARLGGSKGGKIRVARVSPERRREIARQAVLARWAARHENYQRWRLSRQASSPSSCFPDSKQSRVRTFQLLQQILSSSCRERERVTDPASSEGSRVEPNYPRADKSFNRRSPGARREAFFVCGTKQEFLMFLSWTLQLTITRMTITGVADRLRK